MNTPTSINMDGNQLREIGSGHLRNIFYIQIFNLPWNFSKLVDSSLFKWQAWIFTHPLRLPPVGLASLFSTKVRTRRKREKYRGTQNSLYVKILIQDVYIGKKLRTVGKRK